MLDMTKLTHELKTKNPKIYAELIKIHYIKSYHFFLWLYYKVCGQFYKCRRRMSKEKKPTRCLEIDDSKRGIERAKSKRLSESI